MKSDFSLAHVRKEMINADFLPFSNPKGSLLYLGGVAEKIHSFLIDLYVLQPPILF